MKTIGKLVAVSALCACGFGGYVFYQQNMVPHPAIVQCENIVKNVLPSTSYKLNTAIMTVLEPDGVPEVLLDFESMTIKGKAICKFGLSNGLQKDFIEGYLKSDKHFMLPIGKSPFDVFDIVSVEMNGKFVSQNIINSHYKRPERSVFSRSAPGNIKEIISVDKIIYERGASFFYPNKFMRYE